MLFSQYVRTIWPDQVVLQRFDFFYTYDILLI
jgi:hypothetical protein